MFKVLFSVPVFLIAIVAGVGLWFLIDYLEQFRLYSTLADIGTIFAMAAVFGLTFYVAIAIFAIPIRSVFYK
ncbi:putative membrane protein [Campylobacter pinnipediorum subsp. caledonicus]|uniref:Putative membrane protein n=1 Tax=Campylobacter pinnipediorum subsp. caledonicus TaxID=1874362 RepID=A0A1S6U976_9BACT|nr:ATP-binding protein [Campylobacter pinnipediorum]AQW86638.1 putative membrane protein [Campylobacter pinnipediorum subsp. caledonicus]AQW88288.1 putative membrane protein [Campylobacter pinnipediorum subsp. caledonicus]OPA70573.1 ATP-binding protein [Campylobacter pinnipediorum subsp. caledonicus]